MCCYFAIQINVELRSYTTSCFILLLTCSVIGILNSYSIKNLLWNCTTVNRNFCCFVKLSTHFCCLELNNPKTTISRVCTRSAEQAVKSANASYVNDTVELLTLRINQRNIACCQLSINWRYTNNQAVLTNIILTILECQLLASNLCILRESILLLSSLNKVQLMIISRKACVRSSKLEQLNVSYHCRVLTDDVLQLVLDVVNLKLEISELIATLITLQCSFNNRQTSVKTCKTCILCCQLTIDSLDSCSYCVLLIETCTESLECVLDSSLVSNSLSQSVVSSTLSSFNI